MAAHFRNATTEHFEMSMNHRIYGLFGIFLFVLGFTIFFPFARKDRFGTIWEERYVGHPEISDDFFSANQFAKVSEFMFQVVLF